jgi:hypothetical protein
MSNLVTDHTRMRNKLFVDQQLILQRRPESLMLCNLFKWKRASQQTLRTHCSLKASCATL